MNKLCNKVLEKIKEEKIKPKPKWHFLLKDYFVWLVFSVSVIFGGLAFCVTLAVLLDSDWDIYRQLGQNFWGNVLLSLPYLWIVLMFLFLGFAFYNYKHTKKGYRCQTCLIFGSSVAASVILGLFLHFYLDFGGKIDKYFSQKIPLYENFGCYCYRKKILWTQPEKGFLGGKIIQIKRENSFNLEDFQGVVWEIEKSEPMLIRRPVLLIENEEVKLIGEKKGERIFRAREARPWSKNKKWNR